MSDRIDRATFGHITKRVEQYLKKLYDAGEIAVNDGDCDLVALHITQELRDLNDPGHIREAVKRASYRDAEAGMFGDPHIHPDIADVVLATLKEASGEAGLKR